MKQISDLLDHASNVAAHQQREEVERKRNGEYFNVFRLCRVDHYENMHSYILASLMNPDGNHGQGSIFLDLFLEFLDNSFSSVFMSKQASVFTEYSTDFGRIDILIEDKAGRAIIIENKIYAQDQDSQIRRYNQFALSKYTKDCYRIIYLTLDGHEAAKHSGEGVDYTCLSYEKNILHWLGKCLESTNAKPSLYEPLLQYQNLIKSLVGLDMNNTVDQALLQEMIDAPDGVAAIINTLPAWEKAIIEKNLFGPLTLFSRDNGLEFFVDDAFWSKAKNVYFRFKIDAVHAIYFQCDKAGWNQIYYGIQDSSMNQAASAPLHGLLGGNEWWPYGWQYLEMHKNWTPDVIAEIANDEEGKFIDYIKKVVKELLLEMNHSGII